MRAWQKKSAEEKRAYARCILALVSCVEMASLQEYALSLMRFAVKSGLVSTNVPSGHALDHSLLEKRLGAKLNSGNWFDEGSMPVACDERRD